MAVKTIRLAPGIHLPLDVVTQTMALLGVKGSGKSNVGALLFEGFCDAGLPSVVIDPVGNWYGVRSSWDGKPGGGLPVHIFGGVYGDVPLEKTAGAVIADLIVDEGLSCILDISEFEDGDESSEGSKVRFLTDFARRIYRRKKTAIDPIHLILEEADDYVPQQPMREQARMLRAWIDIVRRGRARGLGITMITQRAASINKNVLEMIDTLIALRTTGPRSRKAIKDWVEHHDTDGAIVKSLSSLKAGRGWIWSPTWLGIVECVQFDRRRTFDSAATPKSSGRRRKAAKLAPVNLGALQKRMAATIEKAKENDPKALRTEIARLRLELDKAQKARPVKIEPKPRRILVPVVKARDRAALMSLQKTMAKAGGAIVKRLDEIFARMTQGIADGVRNAADMERRHPVAGPAPEEGGGEPPPVRPHLPPPGKAPSWGNLNGLGKGPRKILSVIARRYPLLLTPGQVGLLSGFTPSTMRTYLPQLRKRDLVEENGGRIALSTAAKMILGDEIRAEPETPAERIETWRRSLRKGEQAIFDALIDSQGTLSMEEICARTGLKPSSVRTYLPTLKRNKLAEDHDGGVRIARILIE